MSRLLNLQFATAFTLLLVFSGCEKVQKTGAEQDSVNSEPARLHSLRREQVVTLTPEAAAEIRRILAEQRLSPNTVLRVGVRPGPEGSYLYEFGFSEAVDPAADVLSESGGVQIVVAELDVPVLAGTEVFFREQPRRGFGFNNPNAIRTSNGAPQQQAADQPGS